MAKSSFAPFVLLAVLAGSALSAPTVDLLIDHGYQSTGTISLRSTLASVATRKGQTFHFGSTYDTYDTNLSWDANAFATFFNHVVAENGCKWDATEPTEGVSDLTECLAVQSFATSSGASFRGHNTFWHSQTPSWLPGSISASTLVDTIIPQHVQAEISGLGSSVTSWDVVNEIVGDGVTNGMTAWECVKNKNDWPTQTSDGSSTSLVTDLTFVHTAFSTAYKYAGSNTRLSINDYNTGAQDAKTACVLAVLEDVQANTDIPYDRLAIGFQSHVSTSSFVSKSDLKTTFGQLAALGIEALVTELDIAISTDESDTSDLRYQAAIWGDYIDACLYASNCNEFINWDPRDDMSWLGADEAGTLFDTSGNPKPAAFEVAARLSYYASGGAELCATALGTGSCTISATSASSTGGATSSKSVTSTSTSSAPGATQSEYGQCGGIGWTGATVCASGTTCTVSNSYYSQCLP